MTIPDIISDPFLRSLLDVSRLTRDQCITLFDVTDAQPASNASGPFSTDSQRQLTKESKSLHADLAQLRGLNREAILRVRQAKQATAEARQEVDRLHLHLQNLYYEQRHLQGEITAGEAYE